MPTRRIHIDNPPPLPGLQFRHFHPPDDFENMAAITRLAAQVDGTDRADTAEELATFYEHLTNCDPSTDLIFAEMGLGDAAPEAIGHSRVEWRRIDDHTIWYIFYGRIKPGWRRKGIGAAMLAWIEARARAIASAHPPEAEKLLVSFVTQGETGLAAMLEKSGYRPIRYLHQMVRPDLEDIPDFPLPDGIEVRPALPEHYRAIWDADVEAFRDHWGVVEASEEDFQNMLAQKAVFQPELWQVAWDTETNQIAGQVHTFIDHEQNRLYNRLRGWTEGISVRRPWRRRGLARALIVRSLRAQKAAGMRESALGVDSENLSGAPRVYAACGFRVTKTTTVYAKRID